MTESIGNNSAQQLRSYVERIERLNDDKAAILADIKEVKAEAKANGFDPTILSEVVKIRAMDPDKRAYKIQQLELYLQSIGMGEIYEGGSTEPD